MAVVDPEGDTGVHEVKPFSSPLNDLARNSCGQIEVLDDASATSAAASKWRCAPPVG